MLVKQDMQKDAGDLTKWDRDRLEWAFAELDAAVDNFLINYDFAQVKESDIQRLRDARREA
jgi:hypothetical protein